MKVATHKAICRKTDDMVLGVVGKDWNIFQNHEIFSFVDELHKMGLVKYNSAGQFKNGKIVWVQAEFMESEILPGDVHKKNLLISNAFDSIQSLRIGWTDVRISCYNTFVAALKEIFKSGHAIRHTASMRDQVAVAKDALLNAESQARQIDMFQKALTKLQMTSQMWKDYTEALFPDPGEGKNKTRAENARNEILSLSIMGRGQDIPGVQGTGYAALNAVTEYVNYHRSSRGENDQAKQSNRFQASLFGSGYQMIGKSMNMLNDYLVEHNIQL